MYNNAFGGDRDQELERLLNDQQFEAAQALLDDWYTQEPWNTEVLMRMAVVHWVAGEPARTLRDLDAVLAMDPENAEALARRAQALLVMGKQADAEASLARAEAIDPHTPGVLLNRALLLEGEGRFEEAIAALDSYLDTVPHDYLALVRRSHLQRQRGDYPAALADARAAVALGPEDPETHFAEALAQVTMEDGDEALAACGRAMTLRTGFVPAERLRIDLLMDLGRQDEADVLLAVLAARDPEAPHTVLLKARAATARGEFDEALAWMSRFLDDMPDEPYGHYRRGMVYYAMGDMARALADFEEYARLAPRALEAYEQQFLCHLELAQYAEAEAVGRTALAMQPNSYRLLYNLAFAELLLGKVDQALAGFTRAMELAPSVEELLVRVHLALIDHAPVEMRVRWFAEMAERFGTQTPMAKGLLAEQLVQMGDFAGAARLSADVVAMDPSLPYGYVLGVKALCLLERYPEALALASVGIRALPDDGRLRVARAMALRDTGDYEGALDALAEAQRLMPDDADVWAQRGLVYGSRGDIPEAIREMRTSVTLNSMNPEAWFWLGYFLLHQGQYKTALEAAEQLLTLTPGATEGRFLRGVALRGLGKLRLSEEEMVIVRREDPELLLRLAVDPAIAALVFPPPTDELRDKRRRAA